MKPARYLESMWRDFPAQILESNVLKFLPIASLCRFRAVCKNWNALISCPAFALSHARASSSEDYILLTAQCDRPINPIVSWEVLDVMNNRVFSLSDDFLTKYVQDHLPYRGWSQREILAVDGGLFCLKYFLDSETSVLLVCNPFLKTVKQLPFLEEHNSYDTVVMSIDRISMEYEIFVFNREDDDCYQPNSIDIYESKNGRWRTIIPDVHPLRNSCESWYPVSCFVKLNGFYRTIQHDDYQQTRVVFYDKLTCLTSSLGFDLPCGGGVDDDVKLVVSNNRLFCITSTAIFSKARSITIFEVILELKECIRLTEMPSELLNCVLGDDFDDHIGEDAYKTFEFYKECTVFIGSANCIFICSWIGRSVAYSLLDKSWHRYSDNALLQTLLEHVKWNHGILYGCNNCLSLCAL